MVRFLQPHDFVYGGWSWSRWSWSPLESLESRRVAELGPVCSWSVFVYRCSVRDRL